MARPLHEKMGIKEGTRAIFVNAPADAIKAIDPPRLDIATELIGDFDYIHLFVKNQAEYRQEFPKLKAHLKPTGMLWASWPKSKQLGTDLTLDKIIHFGYSFGLVESICLSVDATWSGLKFTHPKKGKVYNNSHGQLKY